MSGSNLTNDQVNAMGHSWNRIGSCPNCNGRCCNFIVLERTHNEFINQHGIVMKDQWNDQDYLVVPAKCAQCVAGGKCHVFDQPEMPGACQQFPVNPFDSHWRYLKQIGTPCGFEFTDLDGKPWDMTIKEKEFIESKEKATAETKEKEVAEAAEATA